MRNSVSTDEDLAANGLCSVLRHSKFPNTHRKSF